MSDEDEKRIFDKCVRPGRRLLSRIKTRVKKWSRSKRYKTIKDVEWMDQTGIMRLFYIIIIIALIRSLASLIWDAYLFFYPGARPVDPSAMRPYIIPMIAKAMRG